MQAKYRQSAYRPNLQRKLKHRRLVSGWKSFFYSSLRIFSFLFLNIIYPLGLNILHILWLILQSAGRFSAKASIRSLYILRNISSTKRATREKSIALSSVKVLKTKDRRNRRKSLQLLIWKPSLSFIVFKRAQIYTLCSSFLQSFAKQFRVSAPFRRRVVSTALMFFVLFYSVFLFNTGNVAAATYFWSQNNWSGGASSASANHDEHQSGLSTYRSKDANVHAASNLSLNADLITVAEDDEAAFNLGSFNQIALRGTGSEAELMLGLGEKPFTDWSEKLLAKLNLGSGAKDVAVSGSYAYLAFGNSVRVINVSDASNPVPVFNFSTGSEGVNSVFVTANRLYIGTAVSLRIVDITNPVSPVQIGSNAGLVYDVVVDGNRAYVGGNVNMRILDVSNPASIVTLGTYVAQVSSIVVEGNTAYVSARVSGTSFFRILNVSNPASLVQTGSLAVASAKAMVIKDGFAYIGSDFSGLSIVDFRNPAAPSLLMRIYAPQSIKGLALSGNYLYLVSDSNSKLKILNISNPNTPFLVGANDDIGSAIAVASMSDKVYVADLNNGLSIFDAGSINAPVVLGEMLDFTSYRYGTVSDDKLYLSKTNFNIIDISNPSAPANLSSLAMSYPTKPFVVNNVAYISDYTGLALINISNPSQISQLNRLNLGSAVSQGDVEVSGNYAYVARSTNGIYAVDISNPQALSVVDSLAIADARSIEISGGYLFVGDYNNGLKVVDARNPSDLSIVAEYPIATINDVLISGNLLYLVSAAGGVSGIQVLDISNPASPTLLASYETSGNAVRQLTILDDYLYLSDSVQGVKIFDVSDLDNIRMLTNISNAGATFAVPAGNYLYVSDASSLKSYRVKAYAPNGVFTSKIFDALNSEYGGISWEASLPASTGITIKARSANNNSMTGAADWETCNNLSNGASLADSSCIIDGQRYFQYQINFTTSNLDNSPRLDKISFDYQVFQDGSLESLPYDSGSDFNLIAGLSWLEDAVLPFGTSISLSIRSANIEADLASAPWTVIASSSATYLTDNCTKEDGLVTCDQNALPANYLDGADDRWFQYKVTLHSIAFNAPVLDDLKLSYVVNAPPELQNVSAYQSSDGLVYISYEARDSDSLSGSLTPGEVSPSFEYWTGSAWQPCQHLSNSATSTKPVDQADFTAYHLTWSPTLDFDEQYLNNEAKIRVTINDNEAANNTAVLESAVFTLDTKDPVVNSFTIDARSDAVDSLKISVNDDSSDGLQIRISNNNNLSADGKNLDSGSWISFVSAKHWLFNSDNSVVYYQVKDKFGNISNGGNISSGRAPNAPPNILYQDVSSITTSEWREFIAWGESSEAVANFENYRVYRSSNGSDYSQIYLQTDKTVNFLIDTNLDTSLVYYYRVTTEDVNGNISPYSDVISDRPDGQGGSDLTPPSIYNVSVDSINTQSAKISWETDEISDSLVEYIAVTGGNFDDALGVGVASMLDNAGNLGRHEVVLTGLSPNSIYYFRVKSTDPKGNTAVDVLGSDGYSFTTLSGPVISNVNVSNVSNNQAIISWQTDVPSDSYVFYTVNPGPSFDYQAGLVELVTEHSIVLKNLTKGTPYYFYVKSGVGEDRNIIDGQMNYFSFITTADNIVPIISFDESVDIRNLDDDSVQINWTTSKQTNSQIEYGLDTNYGNTLSNNNYNTNHVYDLTGLEKGTRYYVRLNNIDTNGNQAAAEEFSFITTDTTDYIEPVLSNITVDPIFDTSAIVNWSTNEAANSLVEYGVESGNYIASSTGNSYNLGHSQILQGLNIKTTYYYRVSSTDVNNNSTSSAEFSFTTKDRLVPQADVNALEEAARVDGAKNSGNGGGGVLVIDKTDKIAPLISNVSVSAQASDAEVTWQTNELADSFVEYGLTLNNMSGNASRDLSLDHKLSLNQLNPNAKYFYRISSADASGNLSEIFSGEFITSDLLETDIIGDDASLLNEDEILSPEDQAINDSKFVDVLKRTVSFIRQAAKNISLSVLESSLNEQQQNLQELSALTPAPKLVTGPNVKVWEDMAIISWETDKRTSSLVSLAEAGVSINGVDAQTIGNPETLNTQHQVVISGLKPQTSYSYQLKGATSIGANLNSPVSRFTTEAKTAKVENYVVDVISESSASFKWSTSFPTNSALRITPYRNNALAPAEEKTFNHEGMTTLHEMTIDVFEPGVFYKVDLFGADLLGRNLSQSIDVFSTSDREIPLIIDQIKTDSALSAGSTSQVQSIISWLTSRPSTSKVYYRKGISKEGDSWPNETVLDENYTRRHIMVITNFDPGEVYQFQVESIDSNGQKVRSKTHTILAPRQKESVFQIIMKNIEDTFGWVNTVKK